MEKLKSILSEQTKQLKTHYKSTEKAFLEHPTNLKLDKNVKKTKYMFIALINAYKQNHAFKKFVWGVKGLSRGILGGFFILHLTQFTERFTYNKYGFTDQILMFLYQNYQVDTRMTLAYDKMLEEMLMGNEVEKGDAHMFVGLGQTYSTLQNPEFAYQAYMISHYKEPKIMRGNSDLKLDFIAKNQQAIIQEGRNINELLDTLQE